MKELATKIYDTLGDPDLDPKDNLFFLSQAALNGYVSNLMQPAYAKLFASMTEDDIDRILQGFLLKNCMPTPLLDIVKAYQTPTTEGVNA